MNCAIIDDNDITRKLIAQLINLHSDFDLVASCKDAFEAIEVLKKQKIDVLFLDVEMPRMSGLEFLGLIESRPLTVLISANASYAVQAFEYNVVDFLTMPVSETRFIKSIQKINHLSSLQIEQIEPESKNHFFIKEKGGLIRINFDDILFMQALGDYVTIHTTENKFTIRLNLKKAEEKLPTDLFKRVHRSYIVALNKISKIEEGVAVIGIHMIPISENYRSNLLNDLNLL